MPSAPTLPARRRAAARRASVALAALAVFALLLWAFAAFALPEIVRRQIERAGSRALGRAVSVGAVAFAPWTLELDVHDLSVAGAGGAGRQLHVDRLHADIAARSLLRLAPVLDALRIERPQLTLTRLAPGRHDVDDVLARLARPDGPPGAAPARFALSNVGIVGGGVVFDDRVVGRTHRLTDLHLAIPALSTLDEAARGTPVEPRLAFTFDGSRFESSAAATPFRADGDGTLRLRWQGLDAAPLLGYLPDGLPLRLRSAVLAADLTLAFERAPRVSLRISGSVEASGVGLGDGRGADLLDIGHLKVAIDDLRPLERTARLGRIDIDAPRLRASRDAGGRLNLILGPAGGPAAPRPAVPPPAAVPSGWTLALGALSLRAGAIDWLDETTSPHAALALRDVSLQATALRWPLDAPVAFEGAARLGADGAAPAGRLKFSGRGDDREARVAVSVEALPLALGRPYLRPFLVPALAGTLNADATLHWRAGRGGAAPTLGVAARRLRFDALALVAEVDTAPAGRRGAARPAAAASASVQTLDIADLAIEPAARRVAIGSLAVRGADIAVERDADGRWMFERWRAEAPAPAAAGAPAARAPAGAVPWRVSLGGLTVDGGRIAWRDRLPRSAVAIDLSAIELTAGGLSLDTAAPAAAVRFSARIAAPATAPGTRQARFLAQTPSGAAGGGPAPRRGDAVGRIDFRGTVGPFARGVPLAARGALVADELPLAALEPYVGGALNIDVEKAQAGFRGDVAYAAVPGGARIRVHGDAAIDEFRARARGVATATAVQVAAVPPPGPRLPRADGHSAGPQLLNWKSLALRGVDIALAPGAAPRVAVEESVLTDFFARVAVDEQGRINLQDLVRPAPASAPADGAAATRAPGAAAGPAAAIRVGPTSFVNGRVAFTDRVIRPNYSADLTGLTGRLGGFSSAPAAAPASAAVPALAELELRGRAEGSASIEIAGRLNPLARPLALDVKAKVRDLELPPLSPYAVKYAGYGIERGKMSVDVRYEVLPDGRLTASNNIVLHQLVFGDKVEGAPRSLPVKLAVALLADRHGVIDLDLPVSGSLNDPQFSIGGVIRKALGNLIVKAVTAPFTLIASAFGGGGGAGRGVGELSRVDFAPGSEALTPAARDDLDKVAKVLAERPQLTMTVVGESSLAVEREAWKRERLAQLLRSEKRRQTVARGGDARAEVVVEPADHPALLAEVYHRADIAGPRNPAGRAADLAPAEMEALLLDSLEVADDAMRQLAVRRGVAVRDYLASKDLPAQRLFLGDARTLAADDGWTPRAELKLSMQ